jgi:hypothetical protein
MVTWLAPCADKAVFTAAKTWVAVLERTAVEGTIEEEGM